jgi:Coenzyme PQQ synthesis protein D (PqqD)
MMLEARTIVKRSDRQVACSLNDEVVLLNLDKGFYFSLQDVGAHIWNALQEPLSVDEIVLSVVAHFDVASEICRSDVLEFLAGLQKAGMIEVDPPGAGAP